MIAHLFGVLLLVASFNAMAADVLDSVYSTQAQAQTACTACKGSSCATAGFNYNGSVSSYYYCPGSPNYRYFVWGACPSGQSYNAQGKCEAPPPPECPDGQVWMSPSNSCEPVAPEPQGGATDTVGVEVCGPPTDCSSTANWTPWNENVNHDGWTWKANDPHQCGESGGVVTCNTHLVYQAGGAASMTTQATVAVFTGGNPSAPTASASCPTGYSLNAAGVCEQPATPGTASTGTTAGTAATPGAVSCPVGYYADASGSCVSSGTGTANAYGCPSGYTRAADGSCQGSGAQIPGVFGAGAGSGPNAVSSCGGPGQPACNVTLGATLDTPVAEALQTANHGPSIITPVSFAAPAAQCPADVQLPKGITWSWSTVCDFALFLRPFILAFAWLAAGWFVLG